MAETPAPTLIGANSIVVECQFAGGLTSSEQQSLCAQLVKKAKRYTNLPVTLATAADIGPGVNLRQQSRQLLLRVKGRAGAADNGRRPLALEVTPVRLAQPVGKLTPVKSSASLVEVQGTWSIQGPIDAFEKLLGREGRGLHRPITSDS